MNWTADNFLGKRFTLMRHGRGASDFTVVCWDRAKGVRLHGIDGSRDWIPLEGFKALILTGRLVESTNGGGFAHDRRAS